MSITITLTELVYSVLGVAAIFAAVALTRMARNVSRTADEVESVLRRLGPQADATLQALEDEIEDLRSVTCRVDTMMQSVNETAIPLMDDIEHLRQSKKYLSAAAAGVKAGMSSFSQREKN